MVDLVGTCPKGFWADWIAEGDAAGDPATGEEYGWWRLLTDMRGMSVEPKSSLQKMLDRA